MISGFIIGILIVIISYILIEYGLADVPDSGWEERKKKN